MESSRQSWLISNEELKMNNLSRVQFKLFPEFKFLFQKFKLKLNWKTSTWLSSNGLETKLDFSNQLQRDGNDGYRGYCAHDTK